MIKDVKPLLKECEETVAELMKMGKMEVACYVQEFYNSINKLPDAEQRPHGEWIYKDMKGQFCSVCDKQSVWEFNFCPNCGALMVSSNSETENSKSEIVPDYRDGWRLREGEAE